MAALTTLANIKAIAQDDPNIQALTGTEDVVVQVLKDVDHFVKKAVWGDTTELAQRYLAAHLLSAAYLPVGGRGPLSSVSIGGVSRSFTLPYINQKTVLGSTQYGLMYMELRDMTVVPFALGLPKEN